MVHQFVHMFFNQQLMISNSCKNFSNITSLFVLFVHDFEEGGWGAFSEGFGRAKNLLKIFFRGIFPVQSMYKIFCTFAD